jgi:hypothetical protein
MQQSQESKRLDANHGFPRLRSLMLYAVMLIAAVVVFILIVAWGEKLAAPERLAAGESPATLEGKPDALVHVLIALAAVLIAGQLLGRLFRYLGQPPVMGEVVGGILLGPSLLGVVWPSAAGFILPPSVAPYLAVVAQLGVILYMFLVGLELNLYVLHLQAYAAVAISHASIVVPFLLGGARPCSFIRASPAARWASLLSLCSSASRCPSPPSRFWPASSPTGVCRGLVLGSSLWVVLPASM